MKSEINMDYLKKFNVKILSINEDEFIPSSLHYAICANLSHYKIINCEREKIVNNIIEDLQKTTFFYFNKSLDIVRKRQFDQIGNSFIFVENHSEILRKRKFREIGNSFIFVENHSDILEFLIESFSILNSNYKIVQIQKEKNTIYVPIIYHLGKDFCSQNFVRGGEYKFEFLDEDFSPIPLSSGEVEFYKDLLTPKNSIYVANELDFDGFCKKYPNLNYAAIKIDSNLNMAQILDHICEKFKYEPMNLPSNTFAFTFCGRTVIRSI